MSSAFDSVAKDCCGGKCLLRCYPIARVMMCPHPATERDIEAAKLAFDSHIAKREGFNVTSD